MADHSRIVLDYIVLLFHSVDLKLKVYPVNEKHLKLFNLFQKILPLEQLLEMPLHGRHTRNLDC